MSADEILESIKAGNLVWDSNAGGYYWRRPWDAVSARDAAVIRELVDARRVYTSGTEIEVPYALLVKVNEGSSA